MKQSFFFLNKSQTQQSKTPAPLETYWTLAADQLLAALHTTDKGIQQTDAEIRIKQYGLNALQTQRPTSALGLLVRQFKNPLVLILVFAAIVSAFVGEWTDARLCSGIPGEQRRGEIAFASDH